MKKLAARHRALFIQFIKFGIVGVIGFVVDVGVLKLCMWEFGMGPYAGRLVSFMVAVTVTWMCNRLFTFRGQGKGPAHKQWAKFVVACIGGFILNYGTYAVLITLFALVRDYPALGVAAGSIAGMFFNFFAARRVVFR
ncbi:MAG: GtrA family protein [Alphaproteobacteria bacterium]|nr:GtrA family protein [Alphaproteobacteria bacterium]